MKLKLIEYDGYFSLDCEAETVADAALLVRMAVNANKEIRYIDTCANKDGTISADLTIAKRRKQTSSIRN